MIGHFKVYFKITRVKLYIRIETTKHIGNKLFPKHSMEAFGCPGSHPESSWWSHQPRLPCSWLQPVPFTAQTLCSNPSLSWECSSSSSSHPASENSKVRSPGSGPSSSLSGCTPLHRAVPETALTHDV